MKNLILFLLIFVQSLTIHAANIGDDTVNVGQKGSTGDKALIFRDANQTSLGVEHATSFLSWGGDQFTLGDGTNDDKKFVFDIGAGANNPFLLWNSTKQKMGFSNDGNSLKDIGSGSGSGGGSNFNNAFTADDNANAEDGTTNWTNSGGGSFAATSTDPLEGDQSFTFTPSAQNDYVQGPLLDVDRDIFRGRSCQAQIEYIGGDENLRLRIIDAGGNLYKNSEFDLPAHELSATESVFFICPNATEIAGNSDLAQLRVRISNSGASASPLIKWDKSYLGTLIGLTTTTVSGAAHHVGSIQWEPTTNCLWGNNTNSFSRYNADADCDNSPRTVIGNVVDGSSGQRPEVTIANVKTTGFYKVTYSGGLYKPTGTNSCRFRLVGDTTSNIIDAGSVDFQRWSNMEWTVQFNSNPGTNKELQLEALATDSAQCHIDVRSVNLKIDVEYYPDPDEAQKTFQVYRVIPRKADVENKFTATFSGTGALIGRENVPGIMSCNRTGNGFYDCDHSTLGLSVPPNVQCTVVDASGTQNYACNIDGTSSTAFQVRIYQTSNNSPIDRAFNITLTKSGSDYERRTEMPIIVGQFQNSYAESNGVNMRIETCQVVNSGTPSFPATNFCTTWIDSITDSGVGRVDLNLTPGVYTTKVNCNISTYGSSYNSEFTLSASTPSIIQTEIRNNSNTLTDRNFWVTCIGY